MRASIARLDWRGACAAAACMMLAACVTTPADAPGPAADSEPPPFAAPAATSGTSPAPASPRKAAAPATGAAAQPDGPPPREPWIAGAPSIRFKFPSEAVEEDDEASEHQRGKASWYGAPFHGRKTANGERYNMYELTAAHKTLPFGTVVKVKDLNSGRSVDVRINDRGPFVEGRVIDLSKAAAEELGMADDGVKPVSLTVVDTPADAPEAAKDKPKPADARADREKSGDKSAEPSR